MKKRMMMVVFILALLMVCFQRTETVAAAKIKVKKPTITVKKKTKNSVKLSVRSSNKKMSGYKFYQKKGKKYVLLKTVKVKKGSTKKSYSFKRLKKNTSYKFKVVAYRKYKGKTYSASKTKMVKTLNSTSSTNNSSNTGKKDVNEPDDSIVALESGWEQKMLDKVNEYRRKEGVGELVLNQDLCNIALIRCKAESKNFHDNFTQCFKDYYKGLGLDYYYHCSENAAAGPLTWEDALQGWRESPGHYHNMLKEEWTDFGVAYCNGVWYQTFEDRNSKQYFIQECE